MDDNSLFRHPELLALKDLNEENEMELDSVNNNIDNHDNFDKLQQQNNSCAYCKDLVHIINLEFEKCYNQNFGTKKKNFL